MADDDLKELERIDLAKMTVADLARLRSPALRDALLEAVRRVNVAAYGHQNHGSHTNHGTESSQFLEIEFSRKVAEIAKLGGQAAEPAPVKKQ